MEPFHGESFTLLQHNVHVFIRQIRYLPTRAATGEIVPINVLILAPIVAHEKIYLRMRRSNLKLVRPLGTDDHVALDRTVKIQRKRNTAETEIFVSKRLKCEKDGRFLEKHRGRQDIVAVLEFGFVLVHAD